MDMQVGDNRLSEIEPGAKWIHDLTGGKGTYVMWTVLSAWLSVISSTYKVPTILEQWCTVNSNHNAIPTRK